MLLRFLRISGRRESPGFFVASLVARTTVYNFYVTLNVDMFDETTNYDICTMAQSSSLEV